MGGFSLLGALAGGYAQAAERDRRLQFEKEQQARQNALGLTKILLENPAVPPEYKPLLLQYGSEAIQGKKVPDFTKMVMNQVPQINTPAKTQNAPVPPVSLTMPAAPPNPQGLGTGAAPDKAPSLTQGATQANGGAFPQVAPPPIPLPAGTTVPGPTLPGSQPPVTLAPQQIAPAGQFHMLSPQEQMEMEQTIQMNKANEIARQTGRPLVQVLGIKPDVREVSPGAKLVDVNSGSTIAEGGPRMPPPGQIGMEPQFAPGGEFIGVKDHLSNKLLTGDELMRNPEAAKVAQSALDAVAEHEKKTIAKEDRQATRQAQQQARAFAQQMKVFEQRERAKEEALSNTTKTMVEAAPKVLKLSERIRADVEKQQDSLGPLASRWNEYMTGKVGAPNAEFARLRTNVSLLQTMLMRMHTGAKGGEYIMQHFTDLVNSSKSSPENILAALDEIDSYANDVASTSRGMLDNQGKLGGPAKPPKPGAKSAPATSGGGGGFDWNAHPEVKQ